MTKVKKQEKPLGGPKRPFTKADFEAVARAALQPVKTETTDKESEETSESHPSGDSSGNHKH